MAGKARDLTGMRFERLVVLKRVENKGNYPCWLCKCDCGNECTVRGVNLIHGGTKSCGCLQKEKIKEKWKDEEFVKKHNKATSEYMKEKWQDEEYKQAQSELYSERMKEKWQDENYKQLKTEQAKQQWENEEYKEMMKERFKGENNPNYNNELTDEEREKRLEKRFQQSDEYKLWSKTVKEQANFTCDCCGQIGGQLVSHHLNSYKHHPEQRLDIANGVCLCDKCHKEFHYKYLGNSCMKCTKEDYGNFKENKLN